MVWEYTDGDDDNNNDDDDGDDDDDNDDGANDYDNSDVPLPSSGQRGDCGYCARLPFTPETLHSNAIIVTPNTISNTVTPV
jgi:hypothetical protein